MADTLDNRKEIVLAATDMTPNRLRSLGWDCHPAVAKGHQAGLTMEPPVRTAKAQFSGTCAMGAFSYVVDSKLYTTDLGRYCSISKGINIGQTNHPMSFLSTNPALFQRTFRIATGDAFPYKEAYESYNPLREAGRAAHEAVARRTKIGNDVWIGFGVVIVAGVTVGDGAVIGANSVVTKDVPPYAIIGGVPAKVIRMRFSDAVIERLLISRWWDYAPWQIAQVDVRDPVAALDSIDQLRDEGMLPYRPDVIVTR